MWTRRKLIVAGAATMAAPSLGHAQADAIQNFFGATPQLRTLQVLRGDEMIFAEARSPGGLNRMANIKSVSKSVVSLILGTCFDRGEIASINDTIGTVAPRLLPRNATPGAEDITLQDLVTLRAGLERTSGANYGPWVSSPNWIANALSRPFVAEPGTRMLYSTGSTHILGAVLAEVTGKSLLQLVRERLGQPLGIEVPPWTRDPQGYFMGGNEMALRPTAMLKIAKLMRDGGRVGDTQVVSGNWVLASTQGYTRSNWSGLSYGYGWFLSPSGYVLGRGYGGQIIAAHPERNLAVAITSDPTQPARSNGYFGDLVGMLDGPILGLA
ncbi:MAG: serine hydrolase [Pseudomonadota bacterium]